MEEINTKIKHIKFSNLYLGKDKSWFLSPDEEAQILAPSYSSDAKELHTMCVDMEKTHGLDGFAIIHDDVRYRVAKMSSLADTYYVLRKFPEQIPDFNRLGFHPSYIEKLMAQDMTGLVIFAGATNQGKTWSASSLIVERLKRYGGVATTAEDPPEMPLEGTHGKGICFQTFASAKNGGFAEACRNMVRWNPSIIFLGEIRDAETAAEALKASINGHLVIITTHADSVITAIERIQSLADTVSEDVVNNLASGIAAVVHQRLENGKRLILETLFVHGAENEKGIRNIIRTKKPSMLASEIALQKNMMVAGQQGRPISSAA